MKDRAVTGIFFVVVVLASMLTGRFVFSLFCMMLSMGCLYEFYRLLTDSGMQPNRRLGVLLGGFVFGLYTAGNLFGIAMYYGLLGVPLATLIFVAELYRKQERPFLGIAYTFLGVVYVTIPFVFFFAMAFITGTYNHHLPLGFMLILWSNDTGAYLTGKYAGRRKLFERISPAKTWEGLVGGMLFALIASGILASFFPLLHGWQWACMALIIVIFGTFGDLVESQLKRSQKVKDSGTILPGHGGLLDRFDGLLLAVPIVFVFLKLVL